MIWLPQSSLLRNIRTRLSNAVVQDESKGGERDDERGKARYMGVRDGGKMLSRGKLCKEG